MRKISLISAMAACLMGLSASATDYYLIGDVNGWALADESMKFTEGTDGNYTLDVTELKSNFKINDGTWNNNKINLGGAAPLEIGKEYKLEAGGNSGNIKTADNVVVKDAKLTLNPVNLTLFVTGSIEAPSTTLKFFGDVDNSGWKEYDLTDNEYTFTVSLNAYFTFTTGSWAGAWRPQGGEDVKITDNGIFTAVSSGDNGCFSITKPGTYTVKITDAAACSFSVSGFDGTEPIDPPVVDPTYKDLYLVGDQFTWAVNEAYKMTREGNVYTITIPDGLTGAKWKIWDGTWEYNFGCGAEQPVVDVEYDTWFNGSDFTMKTNGSTTIRLTVVEGSDEKNSSIPSKLLITAEGGDTPVIPVDHTFQLCGSFCDWNAANAIEMEKQSDGTYTCTMPLLQGGAQFKVIADNDWVLSFGGEGVADPDLTEQTFVLVKGVAANAWPGSSVNFTYDNALADVKFTFEYAESGASKLTINGEIPAGVESVEAAEEGSVRYFNLQGVEIDEPANGVFVRVAGGKAVKVVK